MNLIEEKYIPWTFWFDRFDVTGKMFQIEETNVVIAEATARLDGEDMAHFSRPEGIPMGQKSVKIKRAGYKYQISLSTSTEEEELVMVDEDIDDGSPAELIVYNDDYNTFNHVIECLVKILKHSAVQAEQLSLMIHFNGKAIVKTAPFKVLKPYKDALVDRGLSAVIEQ